MEENRKHLRLVIFKKFLICAFQVSSSAPNTVLPWNFHLHVRQKYFFTYPEMIALNSSLVKEQHSKEEDCWQMTFSLETVFNH